MRGSMRLKLQQHASPWSTLPSRVSVLSLSTAASKETRDSMPSILSRATQHYL